ncbi:glycoside hydrolase family 2 TIM barrel-domain containing protein [Polaribacter sp. P097]|uniref:glycoside hydrolase family 2 TIM barrel-domain containing protein n=1 Tax=Polaribacter sp. P097 TaxID=3117398 RepID=UPI002FE22372
MKTSTKYLLIFLICLFAYQTNAQKQTEVSIVSNDIGMKLKVNGKDFMINGMNWDYIPIGTNYSFSLWNQSDDFIKKALESEMSLLQDMGVNAIRVYTGIQPKWISYIYKTYGIYTMLNHSFGRYGVTINEVYKPVTDYRDKATKELLLQEVSSLANEYKNTEGLLLYLLGNENNYGLFWAGAETEDFPDDAEMKKVMGEKRGRPMYKLFNEAALLMKQIDKNHPVAMCNGDLLFVDIIADECPDVDIYGTNMYRGKSFGDAFEEVKNKLNKPILFTEFGVDAFNALEKKEDQQMQSFYVLENWKEIYANAYGLGKSGNSIGGFTFQFSDGWWKLGQTINLDKHDEEANWTNNGYTLDTKNNSPNMNEEWFGIAAKGSSNEEGLYQLYPRAAYYVLQQAHQINPFSKGISVKKIERKICKINQKKALKKGLANKKLLEITQKQ